MTTIDYDVPYFRNTPDNNRCFQATLRMVLKYYWPEKEFTWEELDRITAKPKDLWTWPMAGLIWLKENGFDVADIEAFDYDKFIEEPKTFLAGKYGEAVANEQIDHSDINAEVVNARRFVELIRVENRLPDLNEVRKFLAEGYLVIANINAKVLNGKVGYEGHFVVLTGITGNRLILHDPGLPGEKRRYVRFEAFSKAWAYPNDEAKNLMALRFPSGKTH